MKIKYVLVIVAFAVAGVITWGVVSSFQTTQQEDVAVPVQGGVPSETQELPPTENTSEAPSSVIVPTTAPSGANVQVTTLVTSESKPKAQTTFTLAEVATHNSEKSCYSVVNGVVYDLTEWIAKHPGGQGAIKRMCGVDGTAGFTGKHGGQAGPEGTLDRYKIGTLVR